MTNPKPHPAPTVSRVEALLDQTVKQKVPVMTALQTSLRMVAHPFARRRSDAEIEADLDNLPI